MSLQDQTTPGVPEASRTGAPVPERSEPERVTSMAAEDAAAPDDDTIHIELNFNAFSDHSPPTQHARRVASYNDPSVQDFADQALELAALRAEVKRLTRDYDALQHAVRVRDMRLQVLQEELSSLRARSRQAEREQFEAQAQPVASTVSDAVMTRGAAPVPVLEAPAVPVQNAPVALPTLEASAVVESAATLSGRGSTANEGPVANDAAVTQELSSTLELPPPNIDTAATVPEIPALAPDLPGPRAAATRYLIPVDRPGDPVPLSREIMTIGRTRDNDICVASRAVSRDHARLVMSARGVTVFDMGSANGCFVNDEPIKRHKLRDGDVLRIGDRSYRYEST